MSTVLGFTGTRAGITDAQCTSLQVLLKKLMPSKVHHGICIGADDDFHWQVRLCCPKAYIIGHPGVNLKREAPTRAHHAEANCDEVLPEYYYLVRDAHIVRDSPDGLIACPRGFLEERRSGTWATVRKGRKQGCKIYLIMPDGTIDEED